MRPGSRVLRPTRVLASLAALCAIPTAVRAQSTWEALLSIDPFPSPYYSDWEANPNLGSLTVLNHGPGDGTIRVAFSIVDGANRVIAQGSSEPQFVAAGSAAIFDSPYELAGTTSHDREIERLASRTGRLPEGEYTACAAATDVDGFILAEACLGFSVFYPDPPLLLAPLDGAVLDRQDELFQWTPVQVPAGMEPQYVLRVAEVLEGQIPAEALAANIPHHESTDLFAPNLQYPFEATPLESGKTYAWSVRAFDANGYPVSTNDGRSEIWTFRYDEGTVPAQPTEGRTFALVNQTAETRAASAGQTRGGLDEICTSWTDPPDVFELRIDVALLDRASIEMTDAKLYQQQSSSEQIWAVVGTRGDRTYMVFGDCALAGLVNPSGLQWLASRNANRGQPLGDLLGGIHLGPNGGGGFGLDYSAVVVALGPTTVEVPDTWLDAVDFLDGHRIEVGTGINLFGVLDLAGNPLGSFLEWLGYPEQLVELQGRVGPQTEWSVGGTADYSSGGGLGLDDDSPQGVARARELVTLRASLPERPSRILTQWFPTMQWGISMTLEDEGDLPFDPSTHWIPRPDSVEVELTITPTVTFKYRTGARWEGGIGLQASADHGEFFPWIRSFFADSTSGASGGTTSFLQDRSVTPVLTLQSDARIHLGPSTDAWYIGDPELEATVDAEFMRVLRDRSLSSLDSLKLEVEVEGRLGHEQYESANARIVLGLGVAAGKSTADLTRGSPSKMDSIRANISRLESEIRTEEAAGNSARVDSLSRTLAIERNALAMWEHAGRTGADSVRADSTAASRRTQTSWKFGIYAGNVPLGTLILDIMSLVRGSP